MTAPGKIGAVVIGRNEGARLVRCLASLSGRVGALVYVDSGSTDASVDAAKAVQAQVVPLDPAHPFTAARARAEGYAALVADRQDPPDYVQFVDGDCEVADGWLEAGLQALDQYPDIGIVTGWRSEIHRDASVYNAMCDFEWRRPEGDILTCGGDMMVRRAAYDQAGGFNPVVIAAEDDEFCARLRKSGWRLHRLPLAMTRHDAAITRFGAWWKRAVRSGHGFAQVGDLHPEYFVTERRRVWLYGFLLPLLAGLGGLFSLWMPVAVLAVYALSFARTARGLRANGLPRGEALHHAAFLSLSKFPNLIGMITYHLRRLRGGEMRIIEYK